MSRKDLTTGGILRNILQFSVPYLAAYFLQLLYGLADLFIIGQFDGVASTTAVSIGSQIMHMLTVMIVGLAMGSTVTIARAVGSRDDTTASKAIGNTAILFIIISIILAAMLFALARPITGLLSTPDEAVEGTTLYLRICFAGIPAITAYNVIASVLRGMGDSRTPMYFVAIACVLNIALDYVFIGGLHLGPSGAALGTVLAQTSSVIVSLVWMRRRGVGVAVSKSDLRIDGAICKEILGSGAPVAVQDGFIQIAFIVITVFANLRGLNDSAAVGVVEKIISMLFLVPSAMLSTLSTFSAQNMGARQSDRVKRGLGIGLAIAMTYGGLVAIVMQFAACQTVGLFTDNADVIRLGGQYLRSYSLDTLLAGIHFCFSGFFIGCGHSIVSFIHNFASVLLARVPLSYFFSIGWPDTLYPMGMAAPLGSLLSVVICVGFYFALRKRIFAIEP